MKLKTNLHFHSGEDPLDIIDYSLFEGIDHAAKLGFDVLASTCHTKNVCREEHVSYAANKGMLLIPGIEANIYDEGSRRRSHVLILNCDTSAEHIRTFEDLRAYRAAHPESYSIAPHPYFYGTFSLKQRLEQHIDLFDAIEHSWFYTHTMDRNTKAEQVAHKYGKPFVATSDTHTLAYIDTNYALIDAEERTVASVFRALSKHAVQNVTVPQRMHSILTTYVPHELLRQAKKLLRPSTEPIPQQPHLEAPVLQPVRARARDSS